MQRFRWFAIVFALVVLMIDVSQVKAQERTLEEVKQEVLRRAPRINFEPDDPDLAPTAPAAPDEAADAHDWERKLGAALGDLPDEQAQMLKLAYYDDRSHSEIAEALHVPLGTVKSRLRLAIGRLRAKFEDKQ